MNKEQYKDTGKLTNVKNSQPSLQQGQAITHEQVSDTLAEGTIDYKLEQEKSK